MDVILRYFTYSISQVIGHSTWFGVVPRLFRSLSLGDPPLLASGPAPTQACGPGRAQILDVCVQCTAMPVKNHYIA